MREYRIFPIATAALVTAFLAAPVGAMEHMDGMRGNGGMGMPQQDMPMGQQEMPMQQQARTATGQGTLQAIDQEAGVVTLEHGPIAELDWPAMTMDFPVADMAMFEALSPGEQVEFEVTMEPDGSYRITDVQSQQ